MRVTILGSGSSSGTPAIDAGWGACDPLDPRNRRLRPAILVEAGDTRILVDTPPDLRCQLLAAGVARLDAVLYTHAHADHLHGIDDLRAVNRARGAALDVYGDAVTLTIIRRRFAYAFGPLQGDRGHFFRPVLIPHAVRAGERWRIGDIGIEAIAQDHGHAATLGFRFGRFAYSTDVVEMDEPAFAQLAGIEAWVLGTLGDRPHPTHCDVEKALAWIARVGPARAWLTHLGLGLDHARLAARLPPGVAPAFDGLVIEVAE